MILLSPVILLMLLMCVANTAACHLNVHTFYVTQRHCSYSKQFVLDMPCQTVYCLLLQCKVPLNLLVYIFSVLVYHCAPWLLWSMLLEDSIHSCNMYSIDNELIYLIAIRYLFSAWCRTIVM